MQVRFDAETSSLFGGCARNRAAPVFFWLERMASIFTQDDLQAVKAALLSAVANGFASVSVANERMDNQSLADLERLLAYIQNDLAQGTTATSATGGMVFRQLVPGGCG